jgi:hypothetical protein
MFSPSLAVSLLPVSLCLALYVPSAAWAQDDPEAKDGETAEESDGDAAPAEGDATEGEAPAAEPTAEEAPAEEAPAEEAGAEEAPAEEAPAEEAPAEEAPAEEAGAEEPAEDAPSEAPPAEEPAEEPAAEEDSKPEVNLVAELGAIWLMGNTKSVTANGLVTFSIAGDGNKFGWNFGGAYGRGLPAASAEVPDPQEWVENARRIYGGARYDRSLLPDVNSVYFAGGAVHDTFAGLRLQAAFNVGYSQLLVNTEKHKLTGEAGFNYSYDLFLEDADPADQHFGGARLFIGYGLTLESFGFGQSVEALLGGRNNLDAPFDGRVLSTTYITANINNILGVKFGFIVNYDVAPPEGFQPVDTTTTLTLVATIM